MKPLGWALLACTCWVGNMLGDLGHMNADAADSWGTYALIFTICFMFSGSTS